MKFISRFILIIISLATTIALSAQEATIKKVAAAPMDISAAKYKRSDLNGAACALVKVQVLTDEVEFTGNVVGTPEHRTGEYWVYLSPGTKMLGIASTSFLPMMLSFPEHGIPELQPATTYIVTLALPESALSTKSTSTTPQYVDESDKYVIFKENGKYGFKEDSRIVIPAKYDDVHRFTEGLASVKINSKWGYINKNDSIVIPAEYFGAWEFSEGLAKVKVKPNGTFGFIDHTGRMAIPAEYGDVGHFSEGLAPFRYYDKWGYIDHHNNKVIIEKYNGAKSFSNGLALVVVKGKWGFIDPDDTMVIPAQYDRAYSFSEGLAAVEFKGKWGYINTSGQMVISPKYGFAGSFSKGLAQVERKKRWFYIDKNETEVDIKANKK